MHFGTLSQPTRQRLLPLPSASRRIVGPLIAQRSRRLPHQIVMKQHHEGTLDPAVVEVSAGGRGVEPMSARFAVHSANGSLQILELAGREEWRCPIS